jgi:GT2 family glycosyltransferase/SAM-dependent methyltransferase
MSWQRRAAAPRLIEWTGERCVPWAPDIPVIYEHYHRYLWAARYTAGRSVLDLGSGEGFGSALLAQAAERVVGVDLDARAVEHSRLNYSAPNLEFQVGTAVDLSAYEQASLGAVVAFEIIEHVRDHKLVLEQIASVLAEDGLLIISTPDRRTYSEATGQVNPFHEHELDLEEFIEALQTHFPHVSAWGQRTITGSHMNLLTPASPAEVKDASDFYIERSGEEWRTAGDPPALYCVALASRVELPAVPAASTLADCGLELVRLKERDAVLARHERAQSEARVDELMGVVEREQAEHQRALRQREVQLQEELNQRERDIGTGQETVAALRAELALTRCELDARASELVQARQLNRRVEESVTWQAFQRARSRLYGALGERSLLSRALRLSLRLAGRLLLGGRRRKPSAEVAEEEPADLIEIKLPEYENPKVSLVIPLHARADLTRACLRSIRDNTTHASYEVILVEDAADPDTKELMGRIAGAQIVQNKVNLGYLRSVNLGAGMARGRWLVLCNNDIEFTRNWLPAMLACAESADDVGVVAPKFVYPDGSLNEAGGVVWRDGTAMNFGRGDRPERFQYEYRREIDYGSAAALMVKASLWDELGGYDERYLPMYYEDADLCFEAREHGLRVLYEPEAIVVHVEGATAGNDTDAGHKRHQESNRAKFAAKWAHRLEAEHSRPALTNVRGAANRRRARHVLVVDYRVPMWHHDAGSLRMLSIVRGLLERGARVTFMPDNFLPLQPYTRALQRLGVEVLYGELDISAELATIGPKLELAILSRPHVASRWLDVLREVAPSARIVYDTVDLHWLRETRKAAPGIALADVVYGRNGGGETLPPRAHALRELECAMIRSADTTLVVSHSERLQVERDVPGADVLVVPTVHEVEPHVRGPKGRNGVLFVGGFAHPPNVDAAVRLVKDVMPLVWRELGEIGVTIVGPDPPPEVQALASPMVDITGWIEDLRPLFERSRLMLAPLRFGAGLKGKITESLAMGLPAVTTPIGAEGLESSENCILVADDPEGLAMHTINICRDDELWLSLSQAGRRLILEHCSPGVVTERLGALLDGEGLDPVIQERALG